MDNLTELLDLKFSNVTDDFNWSSSSGLGPQTFSGKLKLTPNEPLSNFRRGIGLFSATNDRARVRLSLEVVRPQVSTQENTNVLFGLYEGNDLIGEFSMCIDSQKQGETIAYNIDRIYVYSGVSSDVSLRITFVEGWENEIFIEDLNIVDFKVTEDKRVYFLQDNFFENALSSSVSAFDLKEYRVDNVETLSTDFFGDNQNTGSNPLSEWKFAKARLDGSNRVAESIDTNTFNPFVSELGLNFDEVSSFFGGKTQGALNGKDYGSGILNLGVDKPEILNGQLIQKKGAFFIDVDFTKRLKVSFDVITSITGSNVFDKPNYYRNYVIEWNPSTCERDYYYFDKLSDNPNTRVSAMDDGFLSGITGQITSDLTISCDDKLNFNGNSGLFEFDIDYGEDVGNAGIVYNTFDVPEKFEIEWNGNLYSSGFVGVNDYDQQLLNTGVFVSQIKTGSMSTGECTLEFDKNSSLPSKARVRVFSPLGGAKWSVSGICPEAVVVDPPVVVGIQLVSEMLNQGNIPGTNAYNCWVITTDAPKDSGYSIHFDYTPNKISNIVTTLDFASSCDGQGEKVLTFNTGDVRNLNTGLNDVFNFMMQGINDGLAGQPLATSTMVVEVRLNGVVVATETYERIHR